MDIRVRQCEAGQDRRNPLVGECRHDRQRAPGADEERPGPESALERVQAELDRRRSRIDETWPGRREPVDLELRTLGRRPAHEPLGLGGDLLGILPGSKPDRHVRVPLDGQHGLLQVRRAALDPVYVEGGLRKGAEVELLLRLGVHRARALGGELVRTGCEL